MEGFSRKEMYKLRSVASDLSLPFSDDQELLEHLSDNEEFQQRAEQVLNPSRLFGNPAPEPEPEPEPEKTVMGMRPVVFGLVVVAVLVICGLILVIVKKKRPIAAK